MNKSMKTVAFALALAAVLMAGGNAMANDTAKTGQFNPYSSSGTVKTYGPMASTDLLDQLDYDRRTN